MLSGIEPPSANLLDKAKSRSRILSKILSLAYILYSLEAGLLLLWLPWHDIWENNQVLNLYPQVRPLIINPFFKGAVLGLGIVSILMGICQIVQFKNAPRGFFSR